MRAILRFTALSRFALVAALDGIWQLQPTSDLQANPPVQRSSVHVRHCSSQVFVTPYATTGPKDDFKWKFEDALNGVSGAVSIRVTTAHYTDRYISNLCDDPGGAEPTRACTSVPKEDKDSYSFRVEGGLCNPGYYSFVSLGKATSGYYLGLTDKLEGTCADQYKAPAADVVFLSPAEAKAQPQAATWMLVDKNDLSGSYDAECGGMWGRSVVIVAGLASALYVVGGIVYGRRTTGSNGPLLEAHPHFVQWQELHALTMDGVAYSRARLQGRRPMGGSSSGGSYERLSVSRSGESGRSGHKERDKDGERSPLGSRASAKKSKSSKQRSEKNGREPSDKKKRGSKEKSSAEDGRFVTAGKSGGPHAAPAEQDGEGEGEGARDAEGRLLQEVRDDSGLHASQAKIKVKSLLG
eukprot:COSAG02_NODE_3370_length_6858_cov_15.489865_5_plen_410_part_00